MWKADLDKIRAEVAAGWIWENRDTSGELSCFHYSTATQYAKHWNAETINCRGLILDQSGNIVSRPFRKFFNYGERMPLPYTFPVEFTEKIDGSLAQLYWHNDAWHFCGAHQFDPPHLRWVMPYYKSEYDFPDDLREWTIMFEAVHPENRIVVDHQGLIALILIGARHKQFGYELYGKELDALANRYNFLRPISFPVTTVKELLERAETLPASNEGWVIRFSDNERFKVKGSAYRAAHAVMTGVSFNNVFNAVVKGTYENMIEGVPDEFLEQIKIWKQEIDDKVEEITVRTRQAFDSIPAFAERKDWVNYVNRNFDRRQAYYLMLMYDDLDIRPSIYKQEFDRRRKENN